MGIAEQATIQAYENLRRAGITPDVIKQVRQQQAAERQLTLLQPLATPGMLNALQRYMDVIDRHIIPPHGGVSGPRAKASVVLDASGGSADGEGANASSGDGDDDDDGDGDGDSDGPRRNSPAVSTIRSAASSRSSSRAVRRKLKSPHSPAVITHTRALVTLVLISLLYLLGALAFVALGYEEMAVVCLGFAACDRWSLASKLVKPK